MSIADELAKLDALRRSGALSDDEFDAAKRRLLAPGSPAGPNSLGRAANRYVSYQMIAGVVGLVVFLVFVFAVLVPMFTKVTDRTGPVVPGDNQVRITQFP
ncbi:SHOCT domain-containing protein [Kutzneria kofuensis]|uniref:SHOCT domain-containing protein n=1 Tax=Kutzneria kofuensis TaxID=103725 RepID=A0A7W9KSN6_9PSEU|nr:SHOCT domain-containing protein [Kutzneria kofuensis]MBB5897977.1 hypothetical protein [Kutzneria kofuensis]